MYTRERHIVCVGMDIDGVQKQMEEDRREVCIARFYIRMNIYLLVTEQAITLGMLFTTSK